MKVFFNFPASLRTTASLQARQGCYRRPEPSSLSTTCPTEDFKHLNKYRMSLFLNHQMLHPGTQVQRSFQSIYLGRFNSLVWFRLGLVFRHKALCPFSQRCLCEVWVHSAPLGLKGVVQFPKHGGRKRHCGFIEDGRTSFIYSKKQTSIMFYGYRRIYQENLHIWKNNDIPTTTEFTIKHMWCVTSNERGYNKVQHCIIGEIL